MSTGAECYHVELKPGEWYYYLQRWPYGESRIYDRWGPFDSEDQAWKHRADHHANPGGHNIFPYQPGGWANFEVNMHIIVHTVTHTGKRGP